MPYSRRLLLDLWAGIRGVPVSLSRGATGSQEAPPRRPNPPWALSLAAPPSLFASWDKRSSQSPCGVEFTTVVTVPLLEVIPLHHVVLIVSCSSLLNNL